MGRITGEGAGEERRVIVVEGSDHADCDVADGFMGFRSVVVNSVVILELAARESFPRWLMMCNLSLEETAYDEVRISH